MNGRPGPKSDEYHFRFSTWQDQVQTPEM